jgi:DNA-binding NtrC family response regulator
LIAQALAMAGGVKARAAALLGINRTTLVEKMKRLGI